MELEVAYAEAFAAAYSEAGQAQASTVVKQACGGLQRVLRRHQEPQLVDKALAHEPAAKLEMALVDGVEAAAVDADGHGGVGELRR